MTKAIEQVQSRLERLEKEFAEFKAALSDRVAQPWYRQIVGDFAGDDIHAEIVRLGRLIRTGKLKG